MTLWQAMGTVDFWRWALATFVISTLAGVTAIRLAWRYFGRRP